MKILMIGGTVSPGSWQRVATASSVDYILAHPELQVEDPEFDAWCDRVIAAQEKAKQSI